MELHFNGKRSTISHIGDDPGISQHPIDSSSFQFFSAILLLAVVSTLLLLASIFFIRIFGVRTRIYYSTPYLPVQDTLAICSHEHIHECPNTPTRFQIFIQPISGKQVSLEVCPTYSILQVKKLICDKYSIPPFAMRLLHKINTLEDSESLQHYNITRECTIRAFPTRGILGSGKGAFKYYVIKDGVRCHDGHNPFGYNLLSKQPHDHWKIIYGPWTNALQVYACHPKNPAKGYDTQSYKGFSTFEEARLFYEQCVPNASQPISYATWEESYMSAAPTADSTSTSSGKRTLQPTPFSPSSPHKKASNNHEQPHILHVLASNATNTYLKCQSDNSDTTPPQLQPSHNTFVLHQNSSSFTTNSNIATHLSHPIQVSNNNPQDNSTHHSSPQDSHSNSPPSYIPASTQSCLQLRNNPHPPMIGGLIITHGIHCSIQGCYCVSETLCYSCNLVFCPACCPTYHQQNCMTDHTFDNCNNHPQLSIAFSDFIKDVNDIASDTTQQIRYMRPEESSTTCSNCLSENAIVTMECTHSDCQASSALYCPPCYITTHCNKREHGNPTFLRRFHKSMMDHKKEIAPFLEEELGLCNQCSFHPAQIYCWKCNIYHCSDCEFQYMHHKNDEHERLHTKFMIIYDPDVTYFYNGCEPKGFEVPVNTDIIANSYYYNNYGYMFQPYETTSYPTPPSIPLPALEYQADYQQPVAQIISWPHEEPLNVKETPTYGKVPYVYPTHTLEQSSQRVSHTVQTVEQQSLSHQAHTIDAVDTDVTLSEDDDNVIIIPSWTKQA